MKFLFLNKTIKEKKPIKDITRLDGNKMAKKKIGAIKVDWLNQRIEFSPNTEIVFKKSQSITGGSGIEETTITFEVISEKIEQNKYKTYVLESDNFIDDEPIDENDAWYTIISEEKESQSSKKGSSVKSVAKPIPEPVKKTAPAPEPAKKTTPLPEPVKKPAPTPSPTPASTITPAPKLIPTPQPSGKQLSPEIQKQITQLETQITQINVMIQKLDDSFSKGTVNQEEFLKKKGFLGEKLGALMGQLDGLKDGM